MGASVHGPPERVAVVLPGEDSAPHAAWPSLTAGAASGHRTERGRRWTAGDQGEINDRDLAHPDKRRKLTKRQKFPLTCLSPLLDGVADSTLAPSQSRG